MTLNPQWQRVHRARGVSLIEALVALAVLAFGMLGIVGMQATLRLAADTARQNAEAVRIAQAAIEDGRAFSAMASASGVVAYADVAATAASAVPGVASNTTFTITRAVAETADPRLKTLVVDVAWDDRVGQPQGVRLASSLTGIAPALAAATGLPGDQGPTTQPRGRHRDIPADAVAVTGDTTLPNHSRFAPPGGGTVSWIFDNRTGVITSLCSSPGVCIATRSYLLRGYVNFATTLTAPSPADAEIPPSSALAVSVQVVQTAPTASTVTCYTQATASHVAYFCAVPVTDADPRWSGRSQVTGLALAASVADADPALVPLFRVCRYTPVRDHVAPGGNDDHPLDYVDVPGALTNQNFLVIRAGDGTTAFDCPADDATTPLVNGNTWHHQPAA